MKLAHSPAMNPAATTAERGATTAPALPPSRETAQFVTDADWVILDCRVDGAEAIWGEPVQLIGGDMKRVLKRVCEGWGSAVDRMVAPGDIDGFFLPWPKELAAGTGLSVRTFLIADACMLTFFPALAPNVQLAEEGISALQPSQATFAQLFLRHQMLEARHQNYLQHFPGVVFSQRSDNTYGFLGPGFEELTGLNPTSVARNPARFEAIIHENDREHYATEVATLMRAPRATTHVFRIQHVQTGQVRHLMEVRSPRKSFGGLPLGCEGVWLDITRQKVAELRLNENGWKEALAVLTSGLLHDFGNLLSGIYSLSELYHSHAQLDPSTSEGIGMIKEHARQAQQLVRKIISLNRDNTGRRHTHSLNRLTRDQVDLISVILPKGINLSTDFPEEEIPVYIDEVAFRQTLVNFALNSRDAIGARGDIRIKLIARACAEDFAGAHFRSIPAWDRSLAAVVFSDSGAGIPADKLTKIFDPFYTTKAGDTGTGLGLYNSHLFAESENGFIGVRSTVNVETSMILLLPIADLSAATPEIEDVPCSDTRRSCVLLHTSEIHPGSRLENALHARNWEVRNTVAFQELRLFLAEKAAGIDLLLFHQSEETHELRQLLQHTRHAHPHIKIAVSIFGQNPDEVSAIVRRTADVFLRPNRPERELVDELAKLLSSHP